LVAATRLARSVATSPAWRQALWQAYLAVVEGVFAARRRPQPVTDSPAWPETSVRQYAANAETTGISTMSHSHAHSHDVPEMAELLEGAPSNWGRWGEDDQVGALNFLTPQEVLRGVQHIRSGEVITLQRLIGDPAGDPVWPGRAPAVRTMVCDESTWDAESAPKFPGGVHYADDKIDAFLQGSTQYDALGHVWYDGRIWNGYDARTTIGGLRKASVEPLAERGIVGRGSFAGSWRGIVASPAWTRARPSLTRICRLAPPRRARPSNPTIS